MKQNSSTTTPAGIQFKPPIVFLDRWYIQIPIYLILAQIFVACILRIYLAVLSIRKNANKQKLCYKPPILDDSYYDNAPDYALKDGNGKAVALTATEPKGGSSTDNVIQSTQNPSTVPGAPSPKVRYHTAPTSSTIVSQTSASQT